MIDIREKLKKKKWPVPPFTQEGVYGQEVNAERAAYEFASYVNEGRLSARPLCPPGRSKLIPPGESAITSLVKDPNGRIFGGTSGRYCHLFSYNPNPEGNFVIDIGRVADENSINHSLVSLNDGCIFGATCDGSGKDLKNNYEGGYLFRYVPKGDFSCEFGYRVSKIELLTIPVKNEGIVYLVVDEGRKVLYGLTQLTGTIFIYNLETKKVIEKAVLDPSGQEKFSKVLLIDRNGRLYGERQGNIFVLEPEENEVSNITKLPSLKGRETYNCLDSATLDYENGCIYGGGSADGLLFRIHLETKQVTVLGKPTLQARVRAMTATLDGRIYGITGGEGGIAHLFCYDPEIHELKDLGIPLITYPKYWHGLEFDSAVTGQWGEIYFGESDRISHLFIYYPPIKKRQFTLKDQKCVDSE